MILDWLSMSAEQRWWVLGGLVLLLIISIIGVAIENRQGSNLPESNGKVADPKHKMKTDREDHT